MRHRRGKCSCCTRWVGRPYPAPCPCAIEREKEKEKVMSDKERKGSGLARCARRHADRKGGELKGEDNSSTVSTVLTLCRTLTGPRE